MGAKKRWQQLALMQEKMEHQTQAGVEADIIKIKLESIMLSEISQAVRDKYHRISPLTGT